MNRDLNDKYKRVTLQNSIGWRKILVWKKSYILLKKKKIRGTCGVYKFILVSCNILFGLRRRLTQLTVIFFKKKKKEVRGTCGVYIFTLVRPTVPRRNNDNKYILELSEGGRALSLSLALALLHHSSSLVPVIARKTRNKQQ